MSSDVRLAYPTDDTNGALFASLQAVISLLLGDKKFAAPIDLTGRTTPSEAVAKFQNLAPASPCAIFYDKNGNVILNINSEGTSNFNGTLTLGAIPLVTTEDTQTLKNKTILTTDGNVFTAANDVVEGAGLRRTTTQTIAADSALHLINWTAEDWDTNNLHDVTTNNERITILTAGLYHLSTGLIWSDQSTNFNDVNIVIKKNGSSFQQLGGLNSYLYSGSLDVGQTFGFYLRCAINDYFEVAVSRSSGHANTGITSASFFQMIRHGA